MNSFVYLCVDMASADIIVLVVSIALLHVAVKYEQNDINPKNFKTREFGSK